ncbi:MAG: MBL fold metallo-hydrolase [Opitutaceae bacterium]|nr:MBL fold metallo-hydrolase [Opitutaceae bacterium]
MLPIYLNAMSTKFSILGSSSSGNCSLLTTENSKILIDAGFSGRRICQMLEDNGESIDGIDAIFLTHEHGDHAAGIPALCRKKHIRLFANRGTANAIQQKLKHRADWQIFETGTRFNFRDIEIESFSIPHDAHDPVGFTFTCGHGDLISPYCRIGWVTDLGYATERVREMIRNVDLLVLEANYDPELLQADTKRPWGVKQRITSRHGHLSNKAACELLASIENPNWKQVYLAHLSRDCNSIAAITQIFEAIFEKRPKFDLSVVSPGESTPCYHF